MNRSSIDAERQAALTQDLFARIERGNRSADRTPVLPSEYLEVVIDKKR